MPPRLLHSLLCSQTHATGDGAAREATLGSRSFGPSARALLPRSVLQAVSRASSPLCPNSLVSKTCTKKESFTLVAKSQRDNYSSE